MKITKWQVQRSAFDHPGGLTIINHQLLTHVKKWAEFHGKRGRRLGYRWTTIGTDIIAIFGVKDGVD
uniref:Uncharacterized protein n=1 Tax=Caenorhabditis japonica TaxID=281687 RepID=A0A8R1HP25_CAEJA